MNGAGNDFVLIDNRALGLELTSEQIQKICHRQRGVGADGVLLLRLAKGDADLGWDFFNRDGSEGEMCGNGARCFARFAQRHLDGRESLSFETLAGVIEARLDGESLIVNLTPPQDFRIGDRIGRTLVVDRGDVGMVLTVPGLPDPPEPPVMPEQINPIEG